MAKTVSTLGNKRQVVNKSVLLQFISVQFRGREIPIKCNDNKYILHTEVFIINTLARLLQLTYYIRS